MKKKFKSYAVNTFLLAIATISIWQLSSCKGDEAPSAQDLVKSKLTSATWKIQSVKVDGVDQTSVYTGFTLTVTDGNFTTVNGGPAWPASGTWTFTSNDGSRVKRDDGTEIDVEITETTLKLTFEWATTTIGSGRSLSVKGKNVFTLTQ